MHPHRHRDLPPLGRIEGKFAAKAFDPLSQPCQAEACTIPRRVPPGGGTVLYRDGQDVAFYERFNTLAYSRCMAEGIAQSFLHEAEDADLQRLGNRRRAEIQVDGHRGRCQPFVRMHQPGDDRLQRLALDLGK